MLQRREQIEEFNGMNEYRGLGFFDVHIGAEGWHSDVKRNFAGRHAGSLAEQQAVRETARPCLDALWLFLGGVNESARVREGAE